MSFSTFLIEIVAPVIITIAPFYLMSLIEFIREVKNGEISITGDDSIEPETLKIYAERIGSTVLVYNADTHAFIVQVKTREEMFDYFQTEFYYMNVIALEENIEAVFSNESI